MESEPKFDPIELLRTLHSHGLDCVVVGGLCASIHGTPEMTLDVGIVHSTEPENVRRLVSALQDLDAVYRTPPERRLRPNASGLASSSRHLLLTRYWPLDVLGAVGAGRTYDVLLPHAAEVEIAPGLMVRVLDLATLIAVTEETDGAMSLAVLPLMRQTLAEKRRLKE